MRTALALLCLALAGCQSKQDATWGAIERRYGEIPEAWLPDDPGEVVLEEPVLLGGF